MDDPGRLILYWGVVVFSCVFHECAHVWVAWKQGDPTGKDLGRLTLNPLPHIDPFWTLILPALTLYRDGFPIGGPKPAPVNPHNFKNPRVGDLWCSLAGPGSNFLLAAVALILLLAGFHLVPDFMGERTSETSGRWTISWNALFLFSVFGINMNLGLVNLIPVPPLDGSRFLHFIVGPPLDPFMNFIDRAGWLTFIPIYFAFRYLAPYVLIPFWLEVLPMLAFLLSPDYAVSLWEAYWAR